MAYGMNDQDQMQVQEYLRKRFGRLDLKKAEYKQFVETIFEAVKVNVLDA
jgi:hypothetical protein